MRKRKLGVQLYTLRAEAEKFGLAYVLKAISDIGYMVAQPAGFHDFTGRPRELKALLADLNLELAPCSMPLKADDIQPAIDLAGELGLKQVIAGFYGPDRFKDLDAIRRTADEVNAIIEKLKPAGIEVIQHNHNWEFEMLDGRLKYDIYLELCPKVKVELDAYWSQNYGANNAADMMRHLYDRTVLIHMKDGTALRESSHIRPLGEGRLNIREILEAAPATIDNVIVELDHSPYNQIVALQRSYDYMVGSGLGIGYR